MNWWPWKSSLRSNWPPKFSICHISVTIVDTDLWLKIYIHDVIVYYLPYLGWPWEIASNSVKRYVFNQGIHPAGIHRFTATAFILSLTSSWILSTQQNIFKYLLIICWTPYISEISKVIQKLKTIPLCLDDQLLPLITQLVNFSLNNAACVPDNLKFASFRPLLKKLGLALFEKNFRPVSTLPFLSKLLEQVVAYQLINYISENNLPYMNSNSLPIQRALNTYTPFVCVTGFL